ncbi:MAG: methyl-accepting chemotaxis protein [Elusimicrobia bacterium]|nr:methyl-accepting chemotaxis protein [Elusimicrobiota bacterium]
MTGSPQAATAASFPRIKRRILLIKKGLQAKFILMVLFSVFFAVVLIGWDFYSTFGRDIVRDLMDPGLYELFEKVSRVLLAKLVIYMTVVAIVAVFLSHKLAGPIYRFERSAKSVGEGDLTHRVHLRKGDELMELQDEFNGMVQSLQELVSKDHHLARRISKQLDDLMLTQTVSPDVLQRIKEIKAEVDHLSSGFKI